MNTEVLESNKRLRRVLVVEDSRLCREVLADLFRDAGYTVEAVGLAREATEALWRNRPDLVLVDLGLPDGRGIDLVAAAVGCEWKPEVIVVSGASVINDRVRALQLGAADFVAKPVIPEELLARADVRLRAREQLLQLRQERDELRARALRQKSALLPDAGQVRAAIDQLWDDAVLLDQPLSCISVVVRPHVDGETLHMAALNAGLRGAVARIQSAVRACDIVCQVGPREFLIIVPDADASAAWQIGARLENTLNAGAGDDPRTAGLRLNAYCGVSTLSEDAADSADTLIMLARRRAQMRRGISAPRTRSLSAHKPALGPAPLALAQA